MKSFSASELRRSLGEILDRVDEEPVSITDHHKPRAVFLSWETYQTLLDTFDAVVEEHHHESLRTGLREFHDGKFIRFEEAVRKMAPVGSADPVESGLGEGGGTILLTVEAEETLFTIVSEVHREQVMRAIVSIGRHPERGRRIPYFPGLKLERASSAHYLVIYRILAEGRAVAIITIVRETGYNRNLTAPFAKANEAVAEKAAARRKTEAKRDGRERARLKRAEDRLIEKKIEEYLKKKVR